MKHAVIAIVALPSLLCACTTLGPNPATTGVSAIPAGRPSLDAQVGTVPAFYASQSAQNEAKGAAVAQAGFIFEPDRWLKLPGLVVGGRLYGQSGDTLGEPYIGYRSQVDDGISVGGGVYGSAKRSTKQLASYHGTRVGAEAGVDAELYAPTSWLTLHTQASLAATRVMTSGTYCVDVEGIAKDCDEMTPANNTMISGKQSGVYPSGTATLSLAAARREGWFRTAQLALLGSVGTMPLIKDGTKQGSGTYTGLGLTLTLGVGD
jgi:hypothetical protein